MPHLGKSSVAFIRTAILTVPVSLLLAGCTETLVYGERSGFNLAIRVDPAQSAPLEVNGGVQRRVVGIIPPQKRTEANGSPDGEAVNMLSNFSLNYEEDSTDLFGGELSIRTSFASGEAAIKVANEENAAEVVSQIVSTNIIGREAISPEVLTLKSKNKESVDELDDSQLVTLVKLVETQSPSMKTLFQEENISGSRYKNGTAAKAVLFANWTNLHTNLDDAVDMMLAIETAKL